MANGDNENTEQTQSSGVDDFDATAFGYANNFQRKIFKGFSPLLSAKEQKDIQTELGFPEPYQPIRLNSLARRIRSSVDNLLSSLATTNGSSKSY